MESLALSKDTLDACIARAAEAIAEGGVVVYPTDTLYGLGADALSDAAVEAVYRLKGREESKPMHAVVADIEMMERYAEVSDDALLLAEAFLPGGLTLVMKKKKGVEHGIARGMETIGLRIPDNNFCLALARALGKPFTATSANIADLPPERSPEAIMRQFGALSRSIRLAIDAGELPLRPPSTVVDTSGEEPCIIREGAVPASSVWEVLGEDF